MVKYQGIITVIEERGFVGGGRLVGSGGGGHKQFTFPNGWGNFGYATLLKCDPGKALWTLKTETSLHTLRSRGGSEASLDA